MPPYQFLSCKLFCYFCSEGDDDRYLVVTEGLKGVFRDERASEAAERVPDTVESLRTS